jgi:LmbE family N-acetylglucosaminyl deacetylase
MRVLAVGAHPDDLEILCGGTLARYAAQGDYVAMCHVAIGDTGTLDEGVIDFATIRRAEAQAAADVIGADSFSLGVQDDEIDAMNRQQRLAVAGLVRRVRPDLIITHSPHDYIDHSEVTKLVLDGSIMAIHPQIQTEDPRYPVVTPVYCMESIGGLNFSPTEYVDISEHMETKLEMFEKHESQHGYLRQIGFQGDMRDQILTTAKFRGHQSGVEYAEGFMQWQVALRTTVRRLLP